MKCNNVPVVEAARRLGKPPQFVRVGLQQNRFPFGTAVKMPGGRWSYYINAARFDVYMKALDMRPEGTEDTRRDSA